MLEAFAWGAVGAAALLVGAVVAYQFAPSRKLIAVVMALGTGLGSAMVIDGVIAPMELGHLPYRKKTYEDYVGQRGRRRLGPKRWEKAVHTIVAAFVYALEPDYVVLGGGNVDDLEQLPEHARRGDNDNAFAGGFRLWRG